MNSNKLHFKEIDWVIYLPTPGAESGSNLEKRIHYLNRSVGSNQAARSTTMKEILETVAIKRGFPHTVCLFRQSFGRGKVWKPRYLEKRVIRNPKDLVHWIKQLETGEMAPLSVSRRFGHVKSGKRHAHASAIVKAFGWVLIAASFVAMYAFLGGKTSFGKGIMNIAMAILLLPAVVILFPVYAVHEGNRTAIWLIYGLFLLGFVLIVLGGRIRGKD
jgi:hypothetical protein